MVNSGALDASFFLPANGKKWQVDLSQ